MQKTELTVFERETFNDKFMKLSEENKDLAEAMEQLTNLIQEKYQPPKNFMNDIEDALCAVITEASNLGYLVGINDGDIYENNKVVSGIEEKQVINFNRISAENIIKHYMLEGWEPVHRTFFKDCDHYEKQTEPFTEIASVDMNTIDVINDMYLAINEWKSIFEPDLIIFEPVISIDDNNIIYIDNKVALKASEYLGYFTCIMGISIVTHNTIFNLTIDNVDSTDMYIIDKIEKKMVSSY